jgi:hypothetical protein
MCVQKKQLRPSMLVSHSYATRLSNPICLKDTLRSHEQAETTKGFDLYFNYSIYAVKKLNGFNHHFIYLLVFIIINLKSKPFNL